MPRGLERKRDKLVNKLMKEKVFCTRIWHTPIILNKDAQRYFDIRADDFPNTLDVARRVVNFPLQNHYTEDDIKKMAGIIRKTLLSL